MTWVMSGMSPKRIGDFPKNNKSLTGLLWGCEISWGLRRPAPEGAKAESACHVVPWSSFREVMEENPRSCLMFGKSVCLNVW